MNRTCGALISILLFSLAGCTSEGNIGYIPSIILSGCLHADEDYIGPDMTPDPCHHQECAPCREWGADLHVCLPACQNTGLPRTDGGTAACDGTCFPLPSSGWSEPKLLWLGRPGEKAPECPAEMPIVEAGYNADPIFLDQCTCDCIPMVGSCFLPSSFTANTSICHQGGTSISFDAPVDWDGSCTTNNQIPASAGVKSLTIAPLTMMAGSCQPDFSKEPKKVPVMWQTSASLCRKYGDLPGCNEDRGRCVPSLPLSSGLLKCVSFLGISECPLMTPYTDRYVLYTKSTQPMDMRTCSSCKCGKQVGSKCTAQLSVYQNDVCAGVPILSVTASSEAVPDACSELWVPDASLLSKSATPPGYIAGTCSSGTAEPELDKGAHTFCCLHEEPPG